MLVTDRQARSRLNLGRVSCLAGQTMAIERQTDMDAGSFAGFARHDDCASVQANEAAHDRKAKAEPQTAFARRVADNAPLAVQMIKRVMRLGLEQDFATALETVATSMPIVRSSEDHMEAVKAFKEKRSPQFKGR